jgi:GNAT superfamily N-acetyltransferase
MVQEAAALLVRGFAASAPEAWPDMAAALEEVYEALEPQKITLVALADDGGVAGWISGRHEYARVWELHPLVVDPARQGQGIGRAPVQLLREMRVCDRRRRAPCQRAGQPRHSDGQAAGTRTIVCDCVEPWGALWIRRRGMRAESSSIACCSRAKTRHWACRCSGHAAR